MQLTKFNDICNKIIKEYIEKDDDYHFNFKNADFSWNEDATSLKEINFTACDGITEIKIDNFYEWLIKNFPEDVNILLTLGDKSKDFTYEDYIIWTMQYCDTNEAGCYIEQNMPLIKFKNAKFEE